MSEKNIYSFRIRTTLDVAAENTWAAHNELYKGLNEIYGYFGTFEFVIDLHEIRGNDGDVIFNESFDFQDSSYIK